MCERLLGAQAGGLQRGQHAVERALPVRQGIGQVRVVQAGPRYKLLAVNEVGDTVLATPAISDGMLFVRGQHHLFGIGRPGRPAAKGR